MLLSCGHCGVDYLPWSLTTLTFFWYVRVHCNRSLVEYHILHFFLLRMNVVKSLNTWLCGSGLMTSCLIIAFTYCQYTILISSVVGVVPFFWNIQYTVITHSFFSFFTQRVVHEYHPSLSLPLDCFRPAPLPWMSCMVTPGRYPTLLLEVDATEMNPHLNPCFVAALMAVSRSSVIVTFQCQNWPLHRVPHFKCLET